MASVTVRFATPTRFLIVVCFAIILSLLTALPLAAQESFLVGDRYSNLNVYNLSTLNVTETANVAYGSWSVALGPNPRLAFVGAAYGISVVDLTLGREIKLIDGIGTAGSLAFSSDGRYLLVADSYNFTLDVVDAVHLRLVRKVSLTGAMGTGATYGSLGSVVVVGMKAYVTSIYTDYNRPAIAVVDLGTFKVTPIRIQAGIFDGSAGVPNAAATPDGKYVVMEEDYNSDGNPHLILISTKTDQVVSDFILPVYAYALLVTPQNTPGSIYGYVLGIGSQFSAFVLDLNAGSPTFGQILPQTEVPLTSFFNSASAAATNPEGTKLVVGGYKAGKSSPNPNVVVIDTAKMLADPGHAIIGQATVNGGVQLQGMAVGAVQFTKPPTAPSVTSVSGPITNDIPNTISVTGTNFKTGALLRIGTMPPLAATVNSPTSLQATVPQNAPAQANLDVIVTNPGIGGPEPQQYQSGLLPRGLTINPNPAFQPQHLLASFDAADYSVAVYQPTVGSMIDVPSPVVPHGITFNGDGAEIYADSIGRRGLITTPEAVAWSPLDGTVEAEILFPVPPAQSISTTLSPSTIAASVNPATGNAVVFVPVVTYSSGVRDIDLEMVDTNAASPTFNTVIATIQAGLPKGYRTMYGGAATPDGKYFYAFYYDIQTGQFKITVFDVVHQTTATFNTGDLGAAYYPPSYISVSPDGQSLLLGGYSTLQGQSPIAILDIGANPMQPVLLATITGTPPSHAGGAGVFYFGSWQVVGNRIFALDYNQGAIVVFKYDRQNSDFSQLSTYVSPALRFSGYLAVPPYGNLLYVPLIGSDMIAVFDTNKLAGGQDPLITNIGAFRAPFQVAVSPVAINPTQLQVATSFLPSGIQTAPYHASLQATGGTPPYTWAIISGNLPPGLTLSLGGDISGTPTQYGTSYFTVQVTDTKSNKATANLSIVIQQVQTLTVTTVSLPQGTQGVPYSATLAATGGVPPYMWSITAGALPVGLVLSTNGNITGIPLTAGTAQFTVQAQDSGSPSQKASANLSITINGNPIPVLNSISPNSAPYGSFGMTLRLYGSGFTSNSIVQWNGVARPTTFLDSFDLSATISAADLQLPGNNAVTVNNPPPGGGVSTAQGFTAYLPYMTNDLIYNPTNQILYASFPSTAGSRLGNSVVPIDPATGVLGNPIWVGSEPGKLALSSDGTVLWVGLDAAGALRKVDLVAQTAGVQFSLGGISGMYDPPYKAVSIAIMPGSPNTVAVATNAGVAIYDNGVRRPKVTNQFYAQGVIFSPTGNELYAAGSGYAVMAVDSTGIVSVTIKNSNVTSNDLRYDSGRVYLTTGVVLDAEQGFLVGTFYVNQFQPAQGPVAPDSIAGRTSILEYGYSGSTIAVYDQNTFVLDGNIAVNPPYGNNVSSLVRWGQDGLAFRSDQAVVTLHSSLIRDLSKTPADMAISATGPSSAPTGSNLAYNLTITNKGPNPATSVALVDTIPAGTLFSSAVASQGSCGNGAIVLCDVGNLAKNGSASVTINVTALNPGAVQNVATVSAAQPDPDLSNNSATTATMISGSPYSPVPSLSSLSPEMVQAGSNSFTLTLSGSQFVQTSVVQWNGTALPTTYVNAQTLTAQVDRSLITAMGWAWVNVMSPAPGGGLSRNLALTIYQAVNLDTNHILFDPFTRKIYASIPGTAPQLTGNSIVSIDPTTGALGAPVNIGSEPGKLAESGDGVYDYVILNGNQRLARYNIITGVADPTTYSLDPGHGGSPSPRDLAVLPGTNSSLAVDLGYWLGNGIFDIAGGSGTFRSKLTGPYTGSSLALPDASHLYSVDIDTSGGEFYRSTIDASGLTVTDGNTLNGFPGSGFKLQNNLVYGFPGGIADPTTTPPTQLGVNQVSQSLGSQFLTNLIDAPDAALNRVFYLAMEQYSTPALISFDPSRYEFVDANVFPPNQIGRDLIRWGKDGLAFQTLDSTGSPGSGRVVLLRGPFVLSTWGSVNPVPGLNSVVPSSAKAGGGNFYLTAIGSNFVPGAVLRWNGSERTTTFMDSSHLKVAIAAADIASPGTATLTVVNPGSAASGGVTFTIQ